MEEFCRLCLSITTEHFHQINESKYKKQLKSLIPELNIELVKEALLCQKCSEVLEAAYELKTRSVRAEQYLRVFVDIMKTDVIPASEILNIKRELDGNSNAVITDIVDLTGGDSNGELNTDNNENTIRIKNDSSDLVIKILDDDHINSDHPKVDNLNIKSNDDIMREIDLTKDDLSPNGIACVICSRKFDSYRHRDVHIYNYHVKIHYVGFTPYEMRSKNNRKHLTCLLCAKQFFTRNGLENHTADKHVNPNKEYSCRFCARKIKGKSKLAIHYRKWHKSYNNNNIIVDCKN